VCVTELTDKTNSLTLAFCETGDLPCKPSHTSNPAPHKEKNMTLGTILLIVLLLLLVGAIPSWQHSRSWGYGPSGGIGLVLVIVLVLLLTGRL
jgi:hypothetical protein